MRVSGGNSQTRRRERRAAERQVAQALAKRSTWTDDEIAELRSLAASVADPSPEDVALDRLESAYDALPDDMRIVFPPETIEAAAELMADGAVVTNESDAESGDLAAAILRQVEGLDFSRAAGRTGEIVRFQLRDLQLVAAATETLPAPVGDGDIVEPAAPSVPRGPREWTALFVPEATLTDDRRAFAPNSLTWRELPLTLMGLNETSADGGHDGAIACGRIDRIVRDGLNIRAFGVFSEDEIGSYYATNVGDGTIRGLSIDIAILDYEVGPESDYFDADGNWRDDAGASVDGTVEDVVFDSEEPVVFVVTRGVIGMATICPFPAFAEASISLVASGAGLRYTHQAGFVVVERPGGLVAAASDGEEMPACASCDHAFSSHVLGIDEELDDEAAMRTAGACQIDGCDCTEYAVPAEDPEDVDDQASITAAAAGLAPLAPPVEWFQNPDLEELTPLSVTDDGRVFGHAWAWGACHTGFPGVCTTAPRSMTNYAYFHTGELVCEGGEAVAVGRITFDTGHAGPRASRRSAVAHYDDTGKVGAYVVVGEDEFGGWVAGALAAEISAEDAQKLRGAAPSGDWRAVNGNLELIGLLAVNVAGFPIPRPRALVASIEDEQRMISLTAAGVEEMLDPEARRESAARLERLEQERLLVMADEAHGVFADFAAEARR